MAQLPKLPLQYVILSLTFVSDIHPNIRVLFSASRPHPTDQGILATCKACCLKKTFGLATALTKDHRILMEFQKCQEPCLGSAIAEMVNMLSVGEGGSTHRLAMVPVCSCLSVAQKEMSSHPQPRVLSRPPGPLMENISEHAFFYLTLHLGLVPQEE